MKYLIYVFMFFSVSTYAESSHVAPVTSLNVSVNTMSSVNYQYPQFNNTNTDVLFYPNAGGVNLYLVPNYKLVFPVNLPVHLMVVNLNSDGNYQPICDIQLLATEIDRPNETEVASIPVADSKVICLAKINPDSGQLIIKLQDITRG